MKYLLLVYDDFGDDQFQFECDTLDQVRNKINSFMKMHTYMIYDNFDVYEINRQVPVKEVFI